MRKFVPIDRTGPSGDVLDRVFVNADHVVLLEPNGNGLTRIVTTKGDDFALWTKVPVNHLTDWLKE